jgi:hypothetical protein
MHEPSEAPESEVREIPIPRSVQVLLGVVLGAFTLLCVAGSVSILLSPQLNHNPLGVVLGVVLLLGCAWVLEKCLRLITGRKNRGGLIAPRTLRVMAVLFLLLPLGGLFTGYWRTNTILAIVQTIAYVAIFLGLWALAFKREQLLHNQSPEPTSTSVTSPAGQETRQP